MKKSVSLLLAGAMCAGLLAGCSSSSTSGGASAAASGSTAPSSVVSGEAGSKSIEKLSIAFVPSREPEEIITATEPLKEMLTAELAGLGYDVGEVEITVGTSYEAVGEALSAGTADAKLLSATSGAVDKAAAKGVIHKNAANRKKARLAKRLAKAQ